MRFFTYVKRNIRRTPYQALAASMVMFVTFLILILFILLALGSEQVLKYYETRPQVIAFFKDNATETDVQLIQKALEQTGKVTSAKYISQEEALIIYKERNKNDPKLSELVTANMLPAALEISTYSPNDLGVLAEILKKEPVVDEVGYPEDVVDKLTQATSVVRSVGSIAVGFLITFAFLVLVMIIGFKIRLKRNEIEIMKLLGASTWFIRAPFILEGIVYGVVGAFFAWATSWILLWYFSPFIENTLGEINILPIPILTMFLLLLVALAVAIIIGGLGSYGAVRRYLRL